MPEGQIYKITLWDEVFIEVGDGDDTLRGWESRILKIESEAGVLFDATICEVHNIDMMKELAP